MTANQLKWQANRIERAKASETERANRQNELILSRKNELEKRRQDIDKALKEAGLKLQKDEDVLRLMEDYAKYGISGMQAMPQSEIRKFAESFGFGGDSYKDEDVAKLVQEAFNIMKNAIGGFVSFKL